MDYTSPKEAPQEPGAGPGLPRPLTAAPVGAASILPTKSGRHCSPTPAQLPVTGIIPVINARAARVFLEVNKTCYSTLNPINTQL